MKWLMNFYIHMSCACKDFVYSFLVNHGNHGLKDYKHIHLTPEKKMMFLYKVSVNDHKSVWLNILYTCHRLQTAKHGNAFWPMSSIYNVMQFNPPPPPTPLSLSLPGLSHCAFPPLQYLPETPPACPSVHAPAL